MLPVDLYVKIVGSISIRQLVWGFHDKRTFSPVHRLFIQTFLGLFLASSCLSMIRADQSKTSKLDKNTIYRLDLFTETLKPNSKKDLKPGAVYFRFSRISGHHVWSRFNEKHIFEFAMGPGSVQPAWRFDIREGREDQLRLLEERSPELYKRLMVQGARPMIKLLENGRWDLDLASNEGRVFDIETGGRWEWHGGRRIRVVHTGGQSWTYQDHAYRPSYAVHSAW